MTKPRPGFLVLGMGGSGFDLALSASFRLDRRLRCYRFLWRLQVRQARLAEPEAPAEVPASASPPPTIGISAIL